MNLLKNACGGYLWLIKELSNRSFNNFSSKVNCVYRVIVCELYCGSIQECPEVHCVSGCVSELLFPTNPQNKLLQQAVLLKLIRHG